MLLLLLYMTMTVKTVKIFLHLSSYRLLNTYICTLGWTLLPYHKKVSNQYANLFIWIQSRKRTFEFTSNNNISLIQDSKHLFVLNTIFVESAWICMDLFEVFVHHENRKPLKGQNFEYNYSQNGQLKRCIESAHEKKKPIKCDTAAFKWVTWRNTKYPLH